MNIIIVDDDKLVSLSLKTILEASGEVNVCAIGNCGEEALSLYPKFKPDILLMDIRMDGMSGLTAGELLCEAILLYEADSGNLSGCQNFISHYVFG